MKSILQQADKRNCNAASTRRHCQRLARRTADISDGRPQLLPQHRARYETPEGEPGLVRVATDAELPVDQVLETLEGHMAI